MINIYKTTENGIEQFNELINNCWIKVTDPTPEEINHLVAMDIPRDFITYPLDIDELSRSEREDDGTLLIIVRIPIFQGKTSDIPYSTIPLGIIVSNKYIVTITRQSYALLDDFAAGKMRGFSTGKRYRFILRLLLNVANNYLVFLREINKLTEQVEDRLQSSIKNKEVMELLKYQKSLVYFTQGIRSNEVLMERLQRMKLFTQYEEDEDLLEDVITENQQAISMTEISTNIMSSMVDAFATIVSNNVNDVMKFLASMTIVLSIPSIVVGFFGMNVPLPMSDHPYAYIGVILLFVILMAFVVYAFLKRDWF
ncbi:magnesium transporter CorA family protein [Leptolinea tardivitalis]|uniref:Magnesium transporter n=1 Tax=Leptolinea tardivitalis TaxID=229920 RepID=A0A0P6WP50_9CHLR|nr:magnesium transporter CorA family protein [Leptolinea tardivitalis]KPL71816.1 magnesium transporter [Leptolinea tardivitalis]GAP20201.1 Mg2+ and Co2+ transporters [Leptolinea tardivitalis]